MTTAAAHADDGLPNKPARRRSRLRRWLWRVGIFVVGTLLLFFIIIQIILWTGLPKNIVVGQVEQGLGLRMGVKSLSTSWLGHTSLENATIALPLSEQAFFDVQELKVDHTNLLGILLGWPVEINQIHLTKPVLYVRQNAAGKWNVQEVAELLARVLGKKTGQQTQATGVPSLPEVHIDDMTIVILNNRNQEVRVEPVNVVGEPDSPVAWKYDVEIPSQQPNVPPHLSFLGRIAPGGLWEHQATIWMHDVLPWVKPFAPQFNQDVAFHGTWNGQLTSSGVGGFLQILDAHVGAYRAEGAMKASQSEGKIAINPDNLRLVKTIAAEAGKPASEISVSIPSGTIDYDGKVARATQVQLNLLGGPAVFNGWFEPDIRQGALEAFWQKMVFAKAGVTQSGKLNVTFSQPIAAPIQISAVASSSGSAPQGTFDAVLKADVTGQSFNDLTWNVTTPQLAYYRPPQPVILNGLNASGTFHLDPQHQLVQMNRISLPTDNRLAGTASFDFDSMQGQLHIEGQDWPIHFVEGTHLAFVVDAAGRGMTSTADPKKRAFHADLNQFTLRSGDTHINLTGSYDSDKPKPLNVHVDFENTPGAAAETGAPALVHGELNGTADLNGTCSPLALDLKGSLTGRDAVVLGHKIGDIKTQVTGGIDQSKAQVRADGIPFLDGIWNFGATYVMKEDNKPIYATTVDFSVERLPLPSVMAFLDAPTVSGTFAGHWYIYFPGLKPDPDKMAITGGGNVRNLAASSFAADELSFNTTLQNSVLKIDPIKLTRGNYGRIDAQAQLDLNNLKQIKAAVTFTGFPIDLASQGVNLQLFGGAVNSGDETTLQPITIYLADAKAKDPAARILRADADFNLRTVISIESQKDEHGQQTFQPEGDIRTNAKLRGRLLQVTQIDGDLVGGKLSGGGVSDLTDLDHIYHTTRLYAAWDKILSERLVRLYPAMKGFGGTYSGQVQIQPASNPRPLEPLAIDVYSQPAAGHWRTVEIGDAEVHAYLGPHRLVASDSKPCLLRLSGGTVNYWFNSSDHFDYLPLPSGELKVSGRTVSNQFNLMLHDLDIDQFVDAFDPQFSKGSGHLNGNIYLLSAINSQTLAAATTGANAPTTRTSAQQQQDTFQDLLRTTTVDGNVAMSDSDLGNFGPVAFLYNAMHLGSDMRKPTGHGDISFHMEKGRLHISNLYYFNRGVEVYGVATVNQMWKFPDSPLDGTVAGSLTPLKNVKIPLFAEAGAVLGQLQQLFSVGFRGTVRHPGKPFLVNFAELGGEIKGILLGEVGK